MLVRVVGLLIQALSCEFFILLNHNKVDNDVLASLSIWSYLLSYLVLLDMFLWLPMNSKSIQHERGRSWEQLGVPNLKLRLSNAGTARSQSLRPSAPTDLDNIFCGN
jgi:hypothetical protein